MKLTCPAFHIGTNSDCKFAVSLALLASRSAGDVERAAPGHITAQGRRTRPGGSLIDSCEISKFIRPTPFSQNKLLLRDLCAFVKRQGGSATTDVSMEYVDSVVERSS